MARFPCGPRGCGRCGLHRSDNHRIFNCSVFAFRRRYLDRHKLMSIRSEDGSQHLTITAPGHVGVPMGPFTVAVLFKNLPFQAAFIWYAYRPDNFSNWNLYSDGDLWYNFLQWDGNLDFS